MKTVYAKHLPYDDGHLGPVLDEMQHCGPPTIRCIRISDRSWAALEGSHRLAAASILGVAPRLVVFDVDVDDYAPDRRLFVLQELPAYRFAEVYVLEMAQCGT